MPELSLKAAQHAVADDSAFALRPSA